MGPIEKVFDPSEYPPEYVAVGKAEALQSILDRVEEAWIRTPNAVLIIPRGAHAFHTTHDFLALGKLQGVREVRISIVSLDPTIAGLASLLGFHLVDPPEGHPALAEDPSMATSEVDENEIEKPTAPLPVNRTSEGSEWVLSSTPAVPVPASLTTSTWLNNPGDAALYDTGDIARGARNALLVDDEEVISQPQTSRPGMPPPRTKPRNTGQLSPAILTTPSIPDEEELDSFVVSSTPSGRIKARRYTGNGRAYRGERGLRVLWMKKAVSWGRVAAVALVLLVLGLSASGFYVYTYLPEGRIAVTPLNRTIPSLPVEVSVITAQPGQGGPGNTGAVNSAQQDSGAQSAPSLSAVMLKADLVEEGTKQASGAREVPKGRGQGTMRFTNRTGGPIFVAAGVQFKGPNGATVQTSQGGTVPATVFGQVFGTADIPIVALVDGAAGNLAAGQVSGIYNGTLNYSNSAMQGGTVETLKVVTQEDIDALVSELRARAESRMGGAILPVVGQGQQLITQTISLANVAHEADHKPGDDGEAVHVKLTAEARAYAYNETDLHDSVAQAVLDWVSNNLPVTAGPSLDMNSVQYTPLSIQAVEDQRIVYSTSADARVTFTLTAELARQIRDLVKGKSLKEARSLITEKFGSYVNLRIVQANVLGFELDKLPDDPLRIKIEAGSAPAVYDQDRPPDAPTTADPRR